MVNPWPENAKKPRSEERGSVYPTTYPVNKLKELPRRIRPGLHCWSTSNRFIGHLSTPIPANTLEWNSLSSRIASVSPTASSSSRYGDDPTSGVTLEPWNSSLSRRSKYSLGTPYHSIHSSGEPCQHCKSTCNVMIIIAESWSAVNFTRSTG